MRPPPIESAVCELIHRAFAQDLGVEFGARCVVDDVQTSVVGVVVDRLDGRVDGVHEHPVRLDVVGDERTGGLRVEHEVQHTRPVSSERTKVGAEVDHQEALDERWPHHLDPEQLADAAARAVAPDDVAAPHPARLAGLEIQDVGHDGIVELLGLHPLMAIAQLGARRCTKLVGQDRLEAVLREVAQRGRCVLEARRPDARTAVGRSGHR